MPRFKCMMLAINFTPIHQLITDSSSISNFCSRHDRTSYVIFIVLTISRNENLILLLVKDGWDSR